MKQSPAPIIKSGDTKLVSGITLSKIKDIFDSENYIYSLYQSRDKQDYLILESRKSHRWICFERIDLDESQKSRLTDQYDIKAIKPLKTYLNFDEATVYRISQDSMLIYIKVVEGTLRLRWVFDKKYEMFFKRLGK